MAAASWAYLATAFRQPPAFQFSSPGIKSVGNSSQSHSAAWSSQLVDSSEHPATALSARFRSWILVALDTRFWAAIASSPSVTSRLSTSGKIALMSSTLLPNECPHRDI